MELMPEQLSPTRQRRRELCDQSALEALPAVTGFYFAFRTVAGLLAARLFGADPAGGVAASVGFEFLLLVAVVFCTQADDRRSGALILQSPAARWALLFLGFSCCSLLWSSTASLGDSSVYWCAMASDVAIVASLLRTRPLTHTADALMQGYVWGALAVALIAWLLPAQSDLRLGDEELLGPNQIGYVCAIGFLFAHYLLREKRPGPAISAVVLAVTLLRSLSKTTIVAFLVSEGFLLLRDRSMSRRSKILVAIAAAAVIAVFSGLLFSYYDVYTSAGNQSETLTGRLGIWAYFLAEAVQQPWIGHGFDSAWKVIPPFGADQFQAAHAHNELLQQFYAYGVVGVLLFAGIYSSLFLQFRHMAAGPRRTFFFAFLLFVLIRGLADTDRFDLSLPLWAVLMMGGLAEKARAAAGQTRELASAGRPHDGAAFHPQMSSDCNL
jgi:exopolysaccharide production protein ExoQ